MKSRLDSERKPRIGRTRRPDRYRPVDGILVGSSRGRGGKPDIWVLVSRPGEGGPPPHAPAHGRRNTHRYDYYPLAQVYFAPDRGRYYWLGPRGWRTGTRLPKSIVIEGEIAVTVELDTDVPHVRHAEVVRKIGKGKSKGKTGK